MGTTASGLRYPEPTEPVSQGATNIANLADDVTTKYPVNKGYPGALTLFPSNGATLAGQQMSILAGSASVSVNSAGMASWTIPGATGVFKTALVSLVVTALHNGPGKYLVALARDAVSAYLYGTIGTAAAPTGTGYAFSYIAIGY